MVEKYKKIVRVYLLNTSTFDPYPTAANWSDWKGLLVIPKTALKVFWNKVEKGERKCILYYYVPEEYEYCSTGAVD